MKVVIISSERIEICLQYKFDPRHPKTVWERYFKDLLNDEEDLRSIIIDDLWSSASSVCLNNLVSSVQ